MDVGFHLMTGEVLPEEQELRLLAVSLDMLWHSVRAFPDPGQPETTFCDRDEGLVPWSEKLGEIWGRM